MEKDLLSGSDGRKEDQLRQLLLKMVPLCLEGLIKENLEINKDTAFCSTSVPQISLGTYFDRIQRYTKCENNTLIAALILIDRFVEKSGTTISLRNIHRLKSK